jgi:large subunit ribosomal protein L24
MKKTIQTLSNHVKQGDTVKVISGKDKGKIGEIVRILKNENKVVVKEVNIKRKHVKPRKEGDVGKISQFEAPIHSSNVMVYNQEQQRASRVGYKTDELGNKIRVFKKLLSTK